MPLVVWGEYCLFFLRKSVISFCGGMKDASSMTNYNERDIEYVKDLGLIRQLRGRKIVIANDIYKETIPRELTLGMQSSITNQEQSWYIKDDNSIDFFVIHFTNKDTIRIEAK